MTGFIASQPVFGLQPGETGDLLEREVRLGEFRGYGKRVDGEDPPAYVASGRGNVPNAAQASGHMDVDWTEA